MKPFQLIDRDWWNTLGTVAARCERHLRIVCPFITAKAIEHLLKCTAGRCRVIARFALEDWANGVSDPYALKWLLEQGAKIRGVRGLHTKLYVFDNHTAILGSANLTAAALTTNHELGVMMTETHLVRRCAKYFDDLWSRAGNSLTMGQLEEWLHQLNASTQTRGVRARPGLPDYGANAGELGTPEYLGARGPARRRRARARTDIGEGALVKFFGSADRRITWERPILEEVQNSGSHWACSYPRNRRPTGVRTGTTIFMGRLMKTPKDTLIFGRAVAVRHVPGRDDATETDIARRPFRRKWPHYVRVLNPEFIQSTFQNGISLFDLMRELGSKSFVSTQRNQRKGEGNTNPRLALRQRPAMTLTPMATELLTQRLDAAFAKYGKIDIEHEPSLDWPTRAQPLSVAGRRLLGVLLRDLAAERIDPEEPSTFPTYGQTITALGLPRVAGPGLGPQLRRNGLDDLDEWTRRFGLPAITGLIVRQNERSPGEEFFELHGRAPDDLEWWRSEIHDAAGYTWERVI